MVERLEVFTGGCEGEKVTCCAFMHGELGVWKKFVFDIVCVFLS